MNQSFVLDASVALAWVLPYERNDYADQVMGAWNNDAKPIVPYVWFIECANAIGKALRRKPISKDEANAGIDMLKKINPQMDFPPPFEVFSAAWPLANLYDLSVYNALYLELSIRKRIPLATIDQKLHLAVATAGLQNF